MLAAALRQATPLVLAGMGGIMSERVGVINIALEGMMLAGAFAGMWASQAGGPLVGVGAAVIVGALMGILHLILTQRLRMDHVISGVAINILALGATTFLLRRVFTQATPQRDASTHGSISVGLFILVAAVLPALLHFVLFRSRFGLRLRAVGESPESARMAGIDPAKLRFAGVVLSGVFAAVAGAYLSLSQVGRFEDDMVSGRGFIALAAVICGRWTPIGTAAAALAFGFFDSLQFQLQGNVQLPNELLRSLPYVFTILAAMLLRPNPPAALGKPEEA
jgi:simple sugar transport system permease protein